MLLDDLLKKVVEEDGSDLHITVGTPPRIRKGGSLIEMSSEKLTSDIVKSMIESKMNEDQLKRFSKGQEIDYSISKISIIHKLRQMKVQSHKDHITLKEIQLKKSLELFDNTLKNYC